MSRGRITETPNNDAQRNIEAAILTAIEQIEDAVSYARLRDMTGIPLNVLWAVTHDLQARRLLLIDAFRQGTIHSMSPFAVEARRRQKAEWIARRKAGLPPTLSGKRA